MSSRSLILLFSSFTFSSALHAHGRQHQHAPRQEEMFSILPFSEEPTPPSATEPTPVPISAPIETGVIPSLIYPPFPEPSPTDIAGIAQELNNCLTEIPLDVINLMNAIRQGLQDLQSQVSGILTAQPTLPTSTPTLAPPPVSLPTIASLPPVSSLGPATFLSTSLPSVTPPALSPPVPFPTALPSLSAPSLSLPDVSLCTPAAGAGALVPCSLPPLSTLTTHLTMTQTINVSVTTHVPLPTNLSVSGLLTGITRSPSLSLPSLSAPSISLASPSLPNPSLSLPSVSVPTGISIASPSLPTGLSIASPSLPTGLSIASPSLPTGLSIASPSLPTGLSVSAPSVATNLPPLSLATVPNLQQTTLSVVASPSLAPLVTPPSPPNLGGIGVSSGLPTFPRTMNLTTITDLVSSKLVSLPTASPSAFIADARDNLATYYGNTVATKPGGLGQLCNNANTDIVIISFVYDFFTKGGYPSLWFGQGSCDSQTPAQLQRAPGLSSCAPLAQQIVQCQQQNKKVLVSLGGYIANSSFSSDLQARQLAVNLWNLFGAGTGDDSTLRPFGSVIVDGFDIDNEDGSQAHWDTFVSAMRALFASDNSKQYYISAAPQCPYPDASNSISTLRQLDFVWVQFYNNPSCNLDSPGFQLSYRQWSNELQGGASMSTSLSTVGPRLHIGIPAFSAAGSGYVDSSALTSYISLAKELWVPNQGGIMLWDGSEALQNVDELGNNYLFYAKGALQH